MELIVTLVIASVVVFFIAKKVVDRETFSKLKFLGFTGILAMLGFGLFILLK